MTFHAPFLRICQALTVLAGTWLASACTDNGRLKVRYELTEGATQKCPSSCMNVNVTCKSVLSIRIVDPAKPGQALASACEVIQKTGTLCEMITAVKLPADERLPAQRLAVQVALFNADDLATPDGAVVCPSDLPFDANNFAAPGPYQPAVAGMGYFEPGDTETVVELGCTDLTVVNTPACRGDDHVRVTASADDFDTGVFVPRPESFSLTVGEPKSRVNDQSLTEYAMPIAKTVDMTPVSGESGAWRAEVKTTDFEQALCVEVYEDTSQATRALSCKRVALDDSAIDLRGIRLRRPTLDLVLRAIGATVFPREGLVIGMVLDEEGKPASGVTVRPSSGTVEYLDSARDKLTGTETSSNGMFLSRDAPFPTSWAALGTSGAYGGLVVDRVTIVILQPDATL